MQAPHPTLKKTAPKKKVWAKKTLKKNWAINGFFVGWGDGGGLKILASP
jgi:hypothetical protein